MISGPLELWGGVECTVVRIGDEWRNQIVETGHDARLGDLDAIAALGVRTLRYPIVWETVAPERPDKLDFGWHDERLGRLREFGIGVVGGLVHHGSGPSYTSLVDPDFAPKLGDYAARVAERYPWIETWTPVNEPLTTARFSCLYGHWYPHARDEASFARALVNQCAGTAAAIRAIRAVNPAAKLLQTEDLGRTFSTPGLAYQARFENLRRWLSLDLLAGRVTPDHGWHERLMLNGIGDDELAAFLDGAATPDIIGINHYLTSERFLDDRVERYPGHDHSGNGGDRYADVEAVRTAELEGQVGPEARLREAWERYGIPLVVSEAHHGCTRDEQLRWFVEVWRAAETLRGEGAEVRAVTLWSLLGAIDWRSLITRREGAYEVGAFDIRGPEIRPTLVAKAAAELAAGRRFDHPALDTPGWWKRPQRFYGAANHAAAASDGRPILITGASGTLGAAFARLCDHRGLPRRLTATAELDVTDPRSIADAIARLQPWAVVNTAGFVRVADAEREREACFRINATGPELLARECARRGLPLVTFSSDLVFDGQLGRAYLEQDAASPVCAYGESKAEAEARVLAIWPETLVVRTSAFFGPWDRYNFVWNTLRTLHRREEVWAGGEIVSPTYVPDLVHATLDLLLDGEHGVWHLANGGALSWNELAQRVASDAGLDRALIRAPERGSPANNALSSQRGLLLRPIGDALGDFMAHGAIDWREAA